MDRGSDLRGDPWRICLSCRYIGYELPRVLPEAVWFGSRRHGVLVGLGIVTRFGLGGRDISDRFEQATIVEPVDPFEGGKFHGFCTAPRAAPMDHLGLEQAVDGFGERVVVAVSH